MFEKWKNQRDMSKLRNTTHIYDTQSSVNVARNAPMHNKITAKSMIENSLELHETTMHLCGDAPAVKHMKTTITALKFALKCIDIEEKQK